MAHDDWSERFGGGALVTGASAGIGEAFAHALAKRGMDVVLVARRRERLEALAHSLTQAHGVRCLPLPVDLTDREAPTTIRRAADDAAFAIGLLVNNAGVGIHGPFIEEDPAEALRMVDLNCRTPVALTHAFLPEMRVRGRGGLIFVSSVVAYQPTPFYATYGATKAFDLMFAEALHEELRPEGIDVLALSPGSTPTEFQSIAGVKRGAHRLGTTSPERVVADALENLGRRPSVIPGALNKLAAFGVRLLPRGWAARSAGRLNAPRSA